MGLNQYHSEMQAKPTNMDYQSRYFAYGDKFVVEGRKAIEGMKQGVSFDGVMRADELTEIGQYKAGWYSYTLTQRAFKKLCAKYDVSQEILLD